MTARLNGPWALGDEISGSGLSAVVSRLDLAGVSSSARLGLRWWSELDDASSISLSLLFLCGSGFGTPNGSSAQIASQVASVMAPVLPCTLTTSASSSSSNFSAPLSAEPLAVDPTVDPASNLDLAPLRRSSRSHKPPSYLSDYSCHFASTKPSSAEFQHPEWPQVGTSTEDIYTHHHDQPQWLLHKKSCSRS
ncbi:hypothetical protein CMV_023057 [Castanea mollissima]|uniref:Uncharacterized protein n=1 Tax=Castanea mollissima TaxID=60419 RepID=A0A8J4QL22_9ROSI|nr:hypothetical protein CMV_023057 [Castanea mollissima]